MVSLMRMFASYRMMEERVKKLEEEREKLLNRLLHAYSGYELDQKVPSYFEAQQSSFKSPSGDGPVQGRKSTVDLMKEYEEACLQEAEGFSNVTVGAARERAQEDMERDAKEYEDRVLKAKRESGIVN